MQRRRVGTRLLLNTREVTFELPNTFRFIPFFVALALNAQTVRFDTTLGGIDVVLRPADTPLTVANFMSYVNSGAYNKSIIHRSLTVAAAVPPYVIQGGGYVLQGLLPVLYTPLNAPVTNEFKISNTRGTLAMALTVGIDTAQDQWYFNTQDNSSTLDKQDFTVFGNVANDAGLAVMDAINTLSTWPADFGQSANFMNLPLLPNYTCPNNPCPLIKPANYVFVNSITPITPADSADGVVNAATAVPNTTTGGISPGEILALYGQELGPTQLSFATLSSTGLVNTSLDGTQVLFNGIPGPMWYTSTGQIAVIVPYEIAGQSTVSVVVSYLGLQTSPLMFNVVPANPGIFTQSYGKGDAVAVRFGDSSEISPSNPASPGDTLILYAEGHGVTSPSLADGAFYTGGTAPLPVAATELLIDEQVVNTLYAGAAGGEVNGVMQINFIVPQLAPGSHQIQIKVGSATSPTGVTLRTK